MELQTTAMISLRSPSPAAAPPISPPTKAPLWWAAPASICHQLTRTLALILVTLALAQAITLATLALAQATTLAIPLFPLCLPHSPPPILPPQAPSLGPVAPPPHVHSPGYVPPISHFSFC